MQGETEDSISIEEETDVQIGGIKDESTQIKQMNPNFLTYSHLQELLNQEGPILPDEETISYQVPSKSLSSNLTNPSSLIKQPSLSDVSKTILCTQSDPFSQFNQANFQTQSQLMENNSDLQYSISQVYDPKEENLNNLMPEINEVSDAEEDSSFNNPEKSHDNIIDSEIYQKYVEKIQGLQDQQLNEENQPVETAEKSPNQQQKCYLDGLSMQQSEVVQSQTYSNHSSASQRVQMLTQKKTIQKNGFKALSLQSNPTKQVVSESESITPNDKNSNIYTYDDDKLELIIELQNEIEDLEDKIKEKEEGLKQQGLENQTLKSKLEEQQKKILTIEQKFYSLQIKAEMDFQSYSLKIKKLSSNPQQNQELEEKLKKLEEENSNLNESHKKDEEEMANLSKVIKEFIQNNDELKNQVKNLEKDIYAKQQMIDQFKENDNINIKKQEDFIATIARQKTRINCLEKTQNETFKHLTQQQLKLKKSEKPIDSSGEKSYEQQKQKNYFDQTQKSLGLVNSSTSQVSQRNVPEQAKNKQLTIVHTNSNGSRDQTKLMQKQTENKFIEKMKQQISSNLINRKNSQGNQVLQLGKHFIKKPYQSKPFLLETYSHYDSYCDPANYTCPVDLKFRNPISTYLVAYQQNSQKYASISSTFTRFSQPKLYGLSQLYNPVQTIF